MQAAVSTSINPLARERIRLPCVRGAVKIGSPKLILTEGLSHGNVAISLKTNANTLDYTAQSLSHFALLEVQNDSSLYTREPFGAMQIDTFLDLNGLFIQSDSRLLEAAVLFIKLQI